MVNIEIDGKKLIVEQGSMVIEAADKAGIPIPRFCYHEKLSIAANCRMCLVQVTKAPKPLPACATPVSEGMQIFTNTEYAKDAQKAVMEFLLINHPLDCPICDQGGQCELQDVALEYGKDYSRFDEGKRSVHDQNIGPLISTEMTRCIHCTRCVRFGTEIAGIRELGATGRGEHMEIGTYIEKSVTSELSGNVIDLCPVGALTSKPFRFKARAWEIISRSTVSSHDALGSNLYHHTYQEKIARTVPKPNETLNELWLSDRDRYSYEGIYSPDRLLEPEIKMNGTWMKISWEEALKVTAERLQHIMHTAGADQIGALASSNCTLEDYYLLQKILRALGSNNLDHRLRLLDTSTQTHQSAYPKLSHSLAALEDHDLFILIGCHPRREVPLLNQRILKATQKGARVISIQTFGDARRYPIEQEILVQHGDLSSALGEIVKALLQNQKNDPELEALLHHVSVSKESQECSQLIKNAKNVLILLGEDIISHPQSSTIQFLAHQIAKIAQANIGEIPAGANAAGAWIAGFIPHRGPIGESFDLDVGKTALEMLQEPLASMLLMNFEPEFDSLHPALSLENLRKVQEVICITPFATESMRSYASILLPMALSSETDGTFINMLGDWQSFKTVTKPYGNAKPAWKILRVLANLLKLPGFQYNKAKEITFEIRKNFEQSSVTDSSILHKIPKKIEPPLKDGLIRLAPMAMYRSDSLVRRAKCLQETIETQSNKKIELHPETAEHLGLQEDSKVTAQQQGRVANHRFAVKLNPNISKGSILLYSGFEETMQLGAPYSVITLERVE